MRNEPLRFNGFVSLELLIVVLVLTLAVAVLWRSNQSRVLHCVNSCLANLKQIDGAKQQWALENKKQGTDIPLPADVAYFLKGGILPVCPQGGKYTIRAVSAVPVCTYPGHTL